MTGVPASSHGTPFNGGTITGATAFAPTSDVAPVVIAGPTGGITDLLEIDTDGSGFLLFSAGGQLSITPKASNLALVTAAGDATTDIQNWASNLGALVARVMASGAIATQAHAAPSDGSMPAGECALWFDQTNGVGNTKLMVKGKSADGTVKTAAILLA